MAQIIKMKDARIQRLNRSFLRSGIGGKLETSEPKELKPKKNDPAAPNWWWEFRWKNFRFKEVLEAEAFPVEMEGSDRGPFLLSFSAGKFLFFDKGMGGVFLGTPLEERDLGLCHFCLPKKDLLQVFLDKNK